MKLDMNIMLLVATLYLKHPNFLPPIIQIWCQCKFVKWKQHYWNLIQSL